MSCPFLELEQAMACCPDGKSYRRLNAIHLLLIGVAYDLVLRNCARRHGVELLERDRHFFTIANAMGN